MTLIFHIHVIFVYIYTCRGVHGIKSTSSTSRRLFRQVGKPAAAEKPVPTRVSSEENGPLQQVRAESGEEGQAKGQHRAGEGRLMKESKEGMKKKVVTGQRGEVRMEQARVIAPAGISASLQGLPFHPSHTVILTSGTSTVRKNKAYCWQRRYRHILPWFLRL